MRPGGSEPDVALRSLTDARRASRTVARVQKVEKRIAVGDEDAVSIRFNTYPQGDATNWLHVEVGATDPNSPNGTAAYFAYDTYGREDAFTTSGDWTIAMGDNGSEFKLTGDASSEFDLLAGGAALLASGDEGDLTVRQGGSGTESLLQMDHSTGNVELRADSDLTIETSGGAVGISGSGGVTIGGNAGTTIQCAGGVTQTLGFYGVTPVTKPSAPSTLSDVIAAGQALGLWA